MAKKSKMKKGLPKPRNEIVAYATILRKGCAHGKPYKVERRNNKMKLRDEF